MTTKQEEIDKFFAREAAKEAAAAATPAQGERLPARWHNCEAAEKQLLALAQERDQARAQAEAASCAVADLLAAAQRVIKSRGMGGSVVRSAQMNLIAAIARAERGQS